MSPNFAQRGVFGPMANAVDEEVTEASRVSSFGYFPAIHQPTEGMHILQCTFGAQYGL